MPEIDLDGIISIRQGIEIQIQIVERREFQRGGLDCTELIVSVDGKSRLIWCLSPFEKLITQDRRNYLVYDPENNNAIKIREEFDKHYGI